MERRRCGTHTMHTEECVVSVWAWDFGDFVDVEMGMGYQLMNGICEIERFSYSPNIFFFAMF